MKFFTCLREEKIGVQILSFTCRWRNESHARKINVPEGNNKQQQRHVNKDTHQHIRPTHAREREEIDEQVLNQSSNELALLEVLHHKTRQPLGQPYFPIKRTNVVKIRQPIRENH